MALAGIGGTVFFHHVGHNAADRAGPLPYVTAMAVAALIGAVVALPALRLRGIYLGLATAAFSLGVEQLLFKEFAAPRRIYPATLVVLIGASLAGAVMVYRRQGRRRAALVTVGSVVLIVVAASNHWLQHERWSALFPNGNLQVPRPRLFGVDFKAQDAFLLLLTAVFCVVAVGLVWLRNSAYGRRLTALKNSPAAAATLGMNVVRLKLSVFMLSAAIAALGGCLYAQQLGAVTSGPFSLFESMSLLMLLVVAGAGFVSGGLAAGLLYGAVFVTMQRIFDKLGQDYSAFSGWFAWLAQFTTVLPALIGVGLGRNPAGFLSDAFSSWRPLIARRRPWMIGVLAVEVGLWVLADSELIGNWTFALATAAILILVPRLGAQVWPDGRDGQGRVLEFIGVDSEFTPADLVVINRGLGLFGAES
jgi:ABC-type branched-subunit amino acid transport system permease subunit